MSSPYPSVRASRAPIRVFAFVVLATAAFAPAAVCAAPEPTPERMRPPHLPDAVHVPNGCHLSTLAFLARYQAEQPGERGRPVVVAMRNADGATRPHTLALITFRGELWCRDEYFGVFPLGLRADAEPAERRLVARIEPRLEQHARLHLARPGSLRPIAAPGSLPAQEALAYVRSAATMLPHPARVFWIRSGTADVPALLFRPTPDEIAVYLPTHGTCVAECNIPDDVRVVELVAARLEYRDAVVRRDQPLPAETPALLAQATK